MRKALKYILVFVCVAMVSCKSKMPLHNTSFSELIVNEDTNTKTEVNTNKAIIDSLSILIGKIKTSNPECDSITQNAIENLLKSINVSKASGDNSYQLKYNDIKRQLELLVKIGATKDEKITNIYNKEILRIETERVEVPVKMPLPSWQIFLIISGIVGLIIPIIKAGIYIRSKIPA